MVNVGDEIVVVDGYCMLEDNYPMTVIHVLSDNEIVVLDSDDNGTALNVYIANFVEQNFQNGETGETYGMGNSFSRWINILAFRGILMV